MGLKVTNNAYAVLNASITSTATTIVLVAGQGARFPTLSAGDYFYATLIDTSNNLEIVKCTARSTDTLTVVRGQDNTTARAYATNDRFELRPTAVMLNEIITTAEAALPKAGGTLTGRLAVSAGTEYTPILVSSTSATNFARAFEGYAPNVANDLNSGAVIVGKAASTRDAGHMSFIKRATAGKESLAFGIYNYDNLMELNGDGHNTRPLQPYFYVQTTLVGDGQTQSNPFVSGTVITNVGSYYNNSTGRFTAPITGVYLFTCQPGYKQSGASFGFRYNINGGDKVDMIRLIGSNFPESHSGVSSGYMVKMTAGDYIYLVVQATPYHSNSSLNFWSGTLLG